MQDAFDLERVTARLRAMEARRRKWQDRANERPGTQQLPEREVTDEFDLAPADLSSGDDSDDGHESSSTSSLPSDDDKTSTAWRRSEVGERQPEEGRAPRARETDSLDLSMSVSSPVKRPPTLLQAEVATCTGASSRSARSKRPGEDPARLQKPSQQEGDDRTAGSEHRANSIFTKSSRIPKLVQQRRKLHASTQPAYVPVNTPRSVLALASAASGGIQTTGMEGHRSSPASGEGLRVSNISEQVRPLLSTQFPSRVLTKPKHSSSVTRPGANNSEEGSMPEEVDSTIEEEQRLLQSLEKLDRRLTNVSAPSTAVREGGHPSLQSERVLNGEDPRVHANTDRPDTSCGVNSKIDEETLRIAAYGGGTHCKLRQPSSLAVRSSSAKRAELSTGVHKARVRVGGAYIQPTDRSGKHKIVVKKELAHLLF